MIKEWRRRSSSLILKDPHVIIFIFWWWYNTWDWCIITIISGWTTETESGRRRHCFWSLFVCVVSECIFVVWRKFFLWDRERKIFRKGQCLAVWQCLSHLQHWTLVTSWAGKLGTYVFRPRVVMVRFVLSWSRAFYPLFVRKPTAIYVCGRFFLLVSLPEKVVFDSSFHVWR